VKFKYETSTGGIRLILYNSNQLSKQSSKMDDDIDMLDLDVLFNASNTENELDMSNPLQSAASFIEGDIDELPTPALKEEISNSTSAKQAGVTGNSIHMILYGNEVRCLVLDPCVSHSANSIVIRYYISTRIFKYIA